MSTIPPKKKGLPRILAACRYSVHGLKFAFTQEAAFRQECLAFFISLIILFFLPVSLSLKIFLFFVGGIVIIVELLNSAIEAIVDMANPEYHDLAKQAKDLGSAAVLVSVTFALLIWGYALITAFTK